MKPKSIMLLIPLQQKEIEVQQRTETTGREDLLLID